MFRNRKLTLKVEKANDEQTDGSRQHFEKKTQIVLHELEAVAVKIFIGICAYVVIDTVRQVTVAKTIYQQPIE